MIRTVTGDISLDNTGHVLMHEHIQCVSNDMLAAFGRRWLDEARLEAYAVGILRQLKERFGVSIFVDGTAIDLGRNTALMQRVSRQSGVHIVASTGLYYYPSMLTCQRSPEDLAQIFLQECQEGMDGTDGRPGILKCAADGIFTPDTAKRLAAVSIAQAKTGLPMYAHCSHEGDLAREMMGIFDRYGAAPERIIFGHVSRRMETAYLESILREGYYICIDQSWAGQEAQVAATVVNLWEKGYGRQILFSHDRSLYNDFAAPQDTGLDFLPEVHMRRFSFLFDLLLPQLRALGLGERDCDLLTKANPLRILDV